MPTWAFLGTIVVGIGMLLFADMFLATEPVRFGCQESILCKLASIALIGLSMDTIIERRRPAPDAWSARGRESTPPARRPSR